MNRLENEKIEGFLNRVERQIFTEDSANEIKEELLDHIECLITDYEEAGVQEEEAISKALLQVGEPKENGYAFRDYEAMKKRKHLLSFFKVSSIVMLLITCLPMIITSKGGWSFSFKFIQSLSFLSLITNGFNIWLAISTGSLLLGHSTKLLDLDSTPFAIVWLVKERFKWEYLMIAFFFVYFYEEKINAISVLAMCQFLH